MVVHRTHTPVLHRRDYSPLFLVKSTLFEAPVVGWMLRHAKQVRGGPPGGVAHPRPGPVVDARQDRSGAPGPEVGVSSHPDRPAGTAGAAAPAAKQPRISRRRTRIFVRFGPPVELSDLRAEPVTAAHVATATDRIMQDITRELEQLRGERAPAQRFDPRAHGLRETGDYRSGGQT